MKKIRYLLDSNVFIEAANRYYQHDTFPSVWNWFAENWFEKNCICSVKTVYDELIGKKDRLEDFIKQLSKTRFLEIDDAQTQNNYTEIVNFVAQQKYTDSAVTTFLAGADPWLIAKAITLKAIIVTHEVKVDTTAKKRIKIPNVCEAFQITTVNTFEMLKDLNARF